MRYIVIIMVIVVYWFLLGFGVTAFLKDPLVSDVDNAGNQSYFITDTNNINMTTDFGEETTLRTFPSALKVMFGFRTPTPDGIPQGFAVIISFINWFSIIIFGISVYRIINPLA